MIWLAPGERLGNDGKRLDECAYGARINDPEAPIRGVVKKKIATKLQEGVGVTRAKTRSASASHADDRLVSILSSRIAERSATGGIWYRFRDTNLGVAVERAESATEAPRVGERRVKEWQTLDAAAAHDQRRRHRVDAAKREWFERTCQA